MKGLPDSIRLREGIREYKQNREGKRIGFIGSIRRHNEEPEN